MPIFKTINQDFFKKWTPEMAYVLGFFTADGCMIKHKNGGHYIEIYITDLDILEKIKDTMGSNHKISMRDRRSSNQNLKIGYRFQVGSKEIFNDLLIFGLSPAKSHIVRMPEIPKKFLSHYVRGYFDGDGHVSSCEYQKKDRKNKSRIIITGFTSGSKKFLEDLLSQLKNSGIVTGGSLHLTDVYHVCFSIRDSLKLYNFMYKNSNDLYLERKKSIFRHYFSNLLGA